MKKLILITLLISVFAVNQAVLASAAQICPTYDQIKQAPFVNIQKSYGENRYSMASDYQDYGSYENGFKYLSFVFVVNGVKAADAGEAVEKVKKALAFSTGAPVVQPGDEDWECVYPLDFSKDPTDYHGAFPVAKAVVYGTDFNNLMPKPKKQ
jgi:hypothetical protein